MRSFRERADALAHSHIHAKVVSQPAERAHAVVAAPEMPVPWLEGYPDIACLGVAQDVGERLLPTNSAIDTGLGSSSLVGRRRMGAQPATLARCSRASSRPPPNELSSVGRRSAMMRRLICTPSSACCWRASFCAAAGSSGSRRRRAQDTSMRADAGCCRARHGYRAQAATAASWAFCRLLDS